VNIAADSTGTEKYEATFELPLRIALESPEDLPAVSKLTDLYEWLEQRGGQRRTSTGAAYRLSELVDSPPAGDPWVKDAVVATERAITRLIDEFLQHPYLHRVESSLHARLYELLMQERILQADYALGTTDRRTQLVHKEWPETIADPGAGRGLFDLAILTPDQLGNATEKQFRQGRISAPIVIEVSLDYGFKHLDQDHQKLLQSKVVAPYLLHLSRIRVQDEPETIKLITNPTPPIRTAYVHHAPNGRNAFKHLGDTDLSSA
jgi:hypothetical protein